MSRTPNSTRCSRLLGGHGEGGAAADVGVEHAGKVKVGEHVGVHDQEVLGEVVKSPEDRAHGAERRLFGQVVDLDAPLRTVAGISLDQLAEVPDGEGRPHEALGGQLPHHDLEDGVLVTDGDERLGDEGRVRAAAAAPSPRPGRRPPCPRSVCGGIRPGRAHEVGRQPRCRCELRCRKHLSCTSGGFRDR